MRYYVTTFFIIFLTNFEYMNIIDKTIFGVAFFFREVTEILKYYFIMAL